MNHFARIVKQLLKPARSPARAVAPFGSGNDAGLTAW
jgi:hypothetical protein